MCAPPSVNPNKMQLFGIINVISKCSLKSLNTFNYNLLAFETSKRFSKCTRVLCLFSKVSDFPSSLHLVHHDACCFDHLDPVCCGLLGQR